MEQTPESLDAFLASHNEAFLFVGFVCSVLVSLGVVLAAIWKVGLLLFGPHPELSGVAKALVAKIETSACKEMVLCRDRVDETVLVIGEIKAVRWWPVAPIVNGYDYFVGGDRVNHLMTRRDRKAVRKAFLGAVRMKREHDREALIAKVKAV